MHECHCVKMCNMTFECLHVVFESIMNLIIFVDNQGVNIEGLTIYFSELTILFHSALPFPTLSHC